jgi:hypothetical protein
MPGSSHRSSKRFGPALLGSDDLASFFSTPDNFPANPAATTMAASQKTITDISSRSTQNDPLV